MAQPTPTRGLDLLANLRRQGPAGMDRIIERARAGEPYVICNLDEAEEICLVMDLPVVAINGWNFRILNEGQEPYYNSVLESRGYPGPHTWGAGGSSYFPLGLGSSLDPSRAPLGGLPPPALIVTGGKSEKEARVCELWGRAIGSPVYAMDFMFSPLIKAPPKNWHRNLRTDWDRIVDPDRLGLRVAHEKGLAEVLERETKRPFSVEALTRTMEMINEQMDVLQHAHDMMAQTRPSPISFEDQLAFYGIAMPARGTATGAKLISDYAAEILQRIASKTAAHPNEKLRIYYEGVNPTWYADMREKHGAVIVASGLTDVPANYAREIKNGDPFAALASRHLLLLASTPDRLLDVVTKYQCDAVIVPELNLREGFPSAEQKRIEAAGIPYLAVPGESDPQSKAMVDRFLGGLSRAQ